MLSIILKTFSLHFFPIFPIHPSLFNLTQLLLRIVNLEDLQKINDQWRSLPLHTFTHDIANEKEPDKF